MGTSEGLSAQLVIDTLRSEGSITAAASALKIPRTTLNDYMRRNNLSVDSSDKHIQSLDAVKPSDWNRVKEMILDRGLDPTEFEVYQIRLNDWGDNSQDRIDIRPLRSMLQPARTDGWKPPKDAKSRRTKKGLAFFFGDQHIPHHDCDLHSIACRMLREHKPEQLILVGDLLDYAAVSRWRKSGDEAKLQETIDIAWGVLRDYREASPGTRIRFVDGNHEERLPNALKDAGFGQVASLRRPGEDHPLLSTAHILRFDELEIEQVFPPQNAGYQQAEIRVFKNLAARHGGKIKKDSGASGIAMLEQTRRNIVFGDTHRQGIVYHTWWDIDNHAHRLVACETGTMAFVDHTGLSYAGEPNWMQGFAVAQEMGDRFSIDLAVYANGVLLWRDYEYSL